MEATITFGQYNVLFKNSWQVIAGDLIDLAKTVGSLSVITLNEADPNKHRAIDKFCKEMRWKQGAHHDSDRILYDPRVWRKTRFSGFTVISPSASQYGIDIPYSPERHMVWQGLAHRATGDKHLVYAAHWVQGYAKPQGPKPTKTDLYRNHAAIKASQISVRTFETHWKRRQQFKFHHLNGDLNARQNNTEQWYYPANSLKKQWVPDTMPGSIDWMLHSKIAETNGLEVMKRWTLGEGAGMDSDHLAHLKMMGW